MSEVNLPLSLREEAGRLVGTSEASRKVVTAKDEVDSRAVNLQKENIAGAL